MSVNMSIMATLKSFFDKCGLSDRQFQWPAFFSVYGSYFPVSLYAS